MSVLEIEAAISRLPADDVKALAEWFTEYQEQLWDKKIEEDVEAGRLNTLIDQAKQQIREGAIKPL